MNHNSFTRSLCRKALVKAAQRRALVVKRVKNGQQLSYRQEILNFLRQIQQLQSAAFFFDSRKARHKLASRS